MESHSIEEDLTPPPPDINLRKKTSAGPPIIPPPPPPPPMIESPGPKLSSSSQISRSDHSISSRENPGSPSNKTAESDSEEEETRDLVIETELDTEIENRTRSISSYVQNKLSVKFYDSDVIDIKEKIDDSQFYKAMETILKNFPVPPTTQPIENGFSWHGGNKNDENDLPIIEEFTLKMIMKFCQSTSFILTTEVECLRQFMLTQHPNIIKKYMETVFIRLASESPFVKHGHGFKTQMGLKKIDNTIKASYPDVRVDKHTLNFAQSMTVGFKLKTLYTDSFTITNNGKFPAEISISNIPCGVRKKAYKVEFEPAKISLKKHKSATVKVSLEIYQGGAIISDLIIVEVKEGKKMPIILKARGEAAVFGVPIEEMENMMIPDSGITIPKVLYKLVKLFHDLKGEESVGIFRVAADEKEVHDLKMAINAGSFHYDLKNTIDVNCIASLIKIWLRELPVQLLHNVPSTELMNSGSLEECLKLMEYIKKPEKDILVFLLDLLTQVVLKESENKMSSKNCAIVIAPNIFDNDSTNPENPMEAVMMSSKAANFLDQLLTNSIAKTKV